MIVRLNQFKQKKINLIFLSALLVSSFQRFLEILAFIIPIQFITAISTQRFSSRLKIIFNLFNIRNINSENQIVFFTIFIFILFLAIITFSRLKVMLINTYKNNIIMDKKSGPNFVFDNVDKFIDNYSLILFCIFLLISLLIYDLSIGIIVILTGITSAIIIGKIDEKYTMKVLSIKNKFIKEDRNLKLNTLSKIKTKYLNNLDSFNSSMNLLTMILIMYNIYFRKDPEVSIIFIFLIRIYLSRFKGILKNINFNYIKSKIFSFLF